METVRQLFTISSCRSRCCRHWVASSTRDAHCFLLVYLELERPPSLNESTAPLPAAIWIPYAVEIDGQIIRVFDSHCHRLASEDETPVEYDRRWVFIERPLVVVGGELTLENADLTWSEARSFTRRRFR